MHFFHPDRKRLSNQPLFTPNGEVRGVLPALHLHPNEDGTIEIGGFFCKTVTVASRLTCTIHISELPVFYQEWLEDPEKVAFEKFGYQIGTDLIPGKAPTRPRPSVPTFSIDDLDL